MKKAQELKLATTSIRGTRDTLLSLVLTLLARRGLFDNMSSNITEVHGNLMKNPIRHFSFGFTNPEL